MWIVYQNKSTGLLACGQYNTTVLAPHNLDFKRVKRVKKQHRALSKDYTPPASCQPTSFKAHEKSQATQCTLQHKIF
jgi:hypothetical protein